MTHLLPAVVVRAVEAMANENSVVFKDDILSMRSERLNLGKLAAVPKKKQKKNLPVVDLEAKEASDASASSEADAPKELPNKKVKTSPKQNPKPKKNKTVASRSSSSSSSDDSSEKPKKKGGKT
jgi:hypothetical protein